MDMKNPMAYRALRFFDGLTSHWNEHALKKEVDRDVLEYRHGGQTPLLATLSLGLYPQASWLVKMGANLAAVDNQGNGVVYRLLKDDTPLAHVFFNRFVAPLPSPQDRAACCEGVFDRLWDLALQAKMDCVVPWVHRLMASGISPPATTQTQPTLIWMIEQVARALSSPPWNSEHIQKEAQGWQEVLNTCLPYLDVDAVDLRGWQVEDVLIRRSGHVPAHVREQLMGLIASTREHLRLHKTTQEAPAHESPRRL